VRRPTPALDTSVTTGVPRDEAASPAAAGVGGGSARESWNFAHFLSSHLASLETRAAILIPAQVSPCRTSSSGRLGGAHRRLVGAAWLITPGRLQRTSILAYGPDARPGPESEAVVQELCANVRRRVRVLHVGLRPSIGYYGG
jgi:hypothetical protein